MLSIFHRALILLTIAIAVATVPASACSTVEGYRTSTNFELVQKAKLIVLARIIDGPRQFADEPEPFSERVRIEPIRVLKGSLPSQPLTVTGLITWNGVDTPSLPSPLSSAHSSVGLGACIRMFYPVGGLVVAMFGPAKPGTETVEMVQLFEPFARVVEDVEGPDAVWVHAVTEYVALQWQRTGSDLRKAVEDRQVALAASKTSNEAQAMASDLAHYLDVTASTERPASRLPHWSYFATPAESVAILAKSGSANNEVLRCGKDGAGVEVVAFGRAGDAALSLSIGDRTFPARAFPPKLPPSVKAMTGLIDFSNEFAELLMTTTLPVQINVAGEEIDSAPPADVLQKLAARCRILLKS